MSDQTALRYATLAVAAYGLMHICGVEVPSDQDAATRMMVDAVDPNTLRDFIARSMASMMPS